MAATLWTDHEGVAQHGDDGAFLQVRTGPVLYGLLGVHPLLALQRVVAEGHGAGAAPLADVLRHAAVRPQHARHAAHRSASHPTKPAFCLPLCKPPNKASVLLTALPATQQSQRFADAFSWADIWPLCPPSNKTVSSFLAGPSYIFNSRATVVRAFLIPFLPTENVMHRPSGFPRK